MLVGPVFNLCLSFYLSVLWELLAKDPVVLLTDSKAVRNIAVMSGFTPIERISHGITPDIISSFDSNLLRNTFPGLTQFGGHVASHSVLMS